MEGGREKEKRKEERKRQQERNHVVSIFFFTEGEMHPEFQEATEAWDLWQLGSEAFLTTMLCSQSLPFRNQNSEITY